MAGVARALRRNNDIGRRMEWDSRDEFGAVAQAYNLVLSRLGSHLQEQQQLGANLTALQAQQRLVDSTPLPIVVTALPTHEVVHANGPGLAWIAERRNDPLSAGLEPAVRAHVQRLLSERGQVDELEVRWMGGAQSGRGLLWLRRLVYEGRDAVLIVFVPVERMSQASQGLSLWTQVFEVATEGIAIFDASRHVVSLNPALGRLTACRTDMVVGRGLEQLLAEDMGRDFVDRLWRIVEGQGRWQGEVLLQRPDGKTVPVWLVASVVGEGEAGGGASRRYTIFSAVDISERKAQEQRIRYLAHHDVLTGLPNRMLFMERLKALVHRARQGDQQVAVLCIDLDHFKHVNDTLGRPAGDALLRSVAQRLLETVRGGDVVCRLGGAELGVALGSIRDGEEALRLAEQRFIPQLRRAHAVGGTEVNVRCSVGVALCPPEEDLDEAMRRADAAMVQAKGRGGDGACLFTAELHERAHRRVLVEAQLRQALERGELSLHYQPRVAAHDGALVGLEALLRWHSARLGPVTPGEFVSVAESSRLIVPIGAWVLDEVGRQLAHWKAMGGPVVPVTVNLSPVQLREPGLATALQAALERHGVAPSLLELELSESAVMDDVEFMLQQLVALKRVGVELAIDDFGTGYSSVPHLQRFPIDALKIDRSVVAELALDPTHLSVTRAIVGMAHTLGLRVVAEGVEDESTAAALRGVACDELQGYHYAQPLPARELEAWATQQQTLQAVTRAESAKPKLQLLTKSDAA
jgi:diguanylate cyclase (GGDEF)-like protein/PAS domain S-box-containing protein